MRRLTQEHRRRGKPAPGAGGSAAVAEVQPRDLQGHGLVVEVPIHHGCILGSNFVPAHRARHMDLPERYPYQLQERTLRPLLRQPGRTRNHWPRCMLFSFDWMIALDLTRAKSCSCLPKSGSTSQK